MWAAIRTETGGRVDTQVLAENNKIQGSDPAALKMLVDGEIQFFTLMGGILGTVVPAAEVQQVPFAFRSAAHAHQAMDGALGAYLREEMAAKGIVGFPVGAFDNGMRQITGTKRPIAAPADLAGIRMRVPAGQLVADTFRALGAEPVTILGVGAIEKRPKILPGADGEDTIAIRTCAYFSISFDHRVIDGAVADQFLAFVKKTIESFPETGL